ncbi:MAG: hypothetical protein Q8R11_02625 [bacterium]|nr:hypothetical protein [bacterium]
MIEGRMFKNVAKNIVSRLTIKKVLLASLLVNALLATLLFREFTLIKLNSIFLPPMSFQSGADSIYIEGSWLDKNTDFNYAYKNPMHTIEIRCDRTKMLCEEVGARFLTEDSKKFPSGFIGLVTYKNEFTVKEWSQEEVVVVLDGGAAKTEMRINIPRKYVSQVRFDGQTDVFFREMGDGFESVDLFRQRYKQ